MILGISRQGYYKSVQSRGRRSLNEAIIVRMVQEIRRRMPRVGSKKLYRMLRKDIFLMRIKLGRDKFLQILRKNGLLVEKKRKYVKTTNSSHRFRVYENLISDLEVTRPDEVYVSDITYIRSEEGFSYLSLITDLYSRKIVGYAFSLSLGLEGSLKALKMSIDGKELKGLIHHSDRGLQYCSNIYTGLLTKRGIKISMSEKGNPYENAVAERLNGILKEEFGLGETFKTREQAEKAVKEAIRTYNEYRPHMSIGYKTPDEKYAA
jgi:transposase InsO family protein